LLVVATFIIALVLAFLGFSPNQFMLAFGRRRRRPERRPSTGSVRLGTTFVTGTLLAVGQDLARALYHLAPPRR
jgi:hypothetical protein